MCVLNGSVFIKYTTNLRIIGKLGTQSFKGALMWTTFQKKVETQINEQFTSSLTCEAFHSFKCLPKLLQPSFFTLNKTFLSP